MTSRLGLALAALITIAVTFAPTPARAHHELTHCQVGINKAFQTIQSALDFVHPEFGTFCLNIQIDAAVWREALVVRHSVTLAGVSFFSEDDIFTTTLAPPLNATGPVTLVKIEGRKVKVKVKHIIFQGPLASGTGGLIGIDLGKDTRLTIRDASFVDIQPAAGDGTATFDDRSGFIGIRVGEPVVPDDRGRLFEQITFADISSVRFEGFQNSAVVFRGLGTTGSLFRNSIDGGGARPAGAAAPAAVVINDGAVADVSRNDIINVKGPAGNGVGVLVNAPGRGSRVMVNNIDSNDIGVVVDAATSGRILRNSFDLNGQGIILGAGGPVSDIIVTGNRVEAGQAGDGIQLVAGSDNVVSTNNILHNSGVGLNVGIGATGNVFAKNRAHVNGGLGFSDPTVGDTRSGTANFWKGNLCKGNNGGGAVQASPAILCTLDRRDIPLP